MTFRNCTCGWYTKEVFLLQRLRQQQQWRRRIRRRLWRRWKRQRQRRGGQYCISVPSSNNNGLNACAFKWQINGDTYHMLCHICLSYDVFINLMGAPKSCKRCESLSLYTNNVSSIAYICNTYMQISVSYFLYLYRGITYMVEIGTGHSMRYMYCIKCRSSMRISQWKYSKHYFNEFDLNFHFELSLICASRRLNLCSMRVFEFIRSTTCNFFDNFTSTKPF